MNNWRQAIGIAVFTTTLFYCGSSIATPTTCRHLLKTSASKALPCYKSLAAIGQVSALTTLGNLYYRGGNNVAQNYSTAFKWYKRSALQGGLYAQLELGIMYYRGKGVAKAPVQAVKWFKKAAYHGNSAAEDWLGYMYSHGEGGLAEEKVVAYAWYSIAAMTGDKIAAQNSIVVAKLLSMTQIRRAQMLAARLQYEIAKLG